MSRSINIDSNLSSVFLNCSVFLFQININLGWSKRDTHFFGNSWNKGLDSHRRQEGNCYKYIFLVWPFQTSNDTFGKNKHCPLHFHTLDEIFLTKDVTGLKTPLSTESVLVETLKKREENIEKPACLIIDGKIIFTKLKAFEGHFWLIDMIND